MSLSLNYMSLTEEQ